MLRLGVDDVGAGPLGGLSVSGGRGVVVVEDGRGKGGGDDDVGAGVDEGLGVDVVVGVDVGAGVVAVDLGAVDVWVGCAVTGAATSPVAAVSAGGVAGVAAGAGSSATLVAVGTSIGTMGASSFDESLVNV